MFKWLMGSHVALVSLLLGVPVFQSADFAAPDTSRLAEAWGGQDQVEPRKCQDCKATIGGCAGNSCTGFTIFGVPFWQKKTGTLMTPMECFVVAENAPGALTCSTNTPKLCYKSQVCSDAACTNCGAQSDVNRDSVCAVGGELCPTTSTDKTTSSY